MALCKPEGISHGSANEKRVRFLDQTIDHQVFIRDLGAAENDHERLCGFLQFLAEELQFAFHQKACCALAAALGHDTRHTFGGSMGAMSGAEGVVHVNFSY